MQEKEIKALLAESGADFVAVVFVHDDKCETYMEGDHSNQLAAIFGLSSAVIDNAEHEGASRMAAYGAVSDTVHMAYTEE